MTRLTLGEMESWLRLEAETKGKTGMEHIVARLHYLNQKYSDCGHPAWGMVNRHLWRMLALYHGGDCFLAGWDGAVPHQKLYPNQVLRQGGYKTLPGWRTPR